ncbi:MAG: flexitail domain-containing putative surface protein, partial [Phycisphaeraceae bacterium]
LDLENTTVSGNQATQGGGMLDHKTQDGLNAGTTAKSSTIAANTASSKGGGILSFHTASGDGYVDLENTIVADNTLNGSPSDCDGPITSQGHNVNSDESCGLAGGGDISSADPLLGPLADNGGPTETHYLLPGSPAIDVGVCPPNTDQRGIPRPQGAGCDIGAIELCPAEDKDCDGLSHEEELQFGTDPLNPNTDSDSCGDGVELGPDPAEGGKRDPLNFWDFMDVPTGTLLARDKSVSGGDISAVVARFGSSDSAPGDFDRDSDPLSTPNATVSPSGARSNYHPAYDRGGTIVGGDPWDLKPADGSIAGGDISAAVVQFGHNCVHAAQGS